MSDPMISAAILAGGLSSRMGYRQKHLVPLNGKPLIQHITGVLCPIFEKIILVINEDIQEYSGKGISSVVRDVYPGKGPLSGIHAAMLACQTPFVFIFACDQPLLDTALIQTMISQITPETEALIPIHESGIEPLHAIYATRHSPVAGEILMAGNGPSVKAFLEKIHPCYYQSHTDSFININTEAELSIIENRLKKSNRQ